MLRLGPDVYDTMVAHALDGLPLEACGLLAVDTSASATASASDDPLVVGVYHSHTHTDAYPSPTDVRQAPDPGWHYVVVSLREAEPMVRSYRIVDGTVSEEAVVNEPR